MTAAHPLAVTGSTGALGGLVARLLAEAGVPQRLLVRDPSRVPALPRTSVRRCDYSDSAAARDALEGVDVLFMVSAAESADRLDQHRSFVDAAAAAGVRQVVYTSFLAAAPDAVFTLARDHFATEEHIKASGMGWTFLRDSFYLDFVASVVGDDDVIRGPGGTGRCAFVSRADVARTAAVILQDPGSHLGCRYDLTGPEALSFAEAAEQLSAARGRTITYHDETVEEAYGSRRKWPAPAWQYDAWVSTYSAIASGDLAVVSSAVFDITGTAPITLAQHLASTDPTV